MSTWFKRVIWIIGFIIWVYCVSYYYDQSCGFTQADGSIDCVFHQHVYHYRGGLFFATVISTLFTPIIVLAIGLWAGKRAIVAAGVKRVIFTSSQFGFLRRSRVFGQVPGRNKLNAGSLRWTPKMRQLAKVEPCP